VLLSAVTTPVRALVQTGEPSNLAREGDPIGLTAEVGGFARPDHGLTTVVTGYDVRHPVEISEDSQKKSRREAHNEQRQDNAARSNEQAIPCLGRPSGRV
jgi:hypothetical protein